MSAQRRLKIDLRIAANVIGNLKYSPTKRFFLEN